MLPIIFLALISGSLAAQDFVTVCYYASWSVYRSSFGKYGAEFVTADLCTHINYAFLGVTPQGRVEILDEWSEIDLGGLAKINALKSKNPDLKTLITIGGFNAGHDILAGIVSSPNLRDTFVKSVLDFLEKWQYDGLDIAWEYPETSERENFVVLLQQFKAAFTSKGYILSATVPFQPIPAYDVPAISDTVDLINIMTYDFHIANGGRTGYNSPLYSIDASSSVSASVTSWLGSGVDRTKTTLSIPFYGHSYTLKDQAKHEVGDLASVGIAGPYTQSPGILGYQEICSQYDSWERVWDEKAQVPYKFSGSNWVSYDDEESVALKVQYAKEKGLAGVAVWSIDDDDFRGACGPQNGLLQVIRQNS